MKLLIQSKQVIQKHNIKIINSKMVVTLILSHTRIGKNMAKNIIINKAKGK